MSTSAEVIKGCGGDFEGPTGFTAKFKEWQGSFDVETEDTTGFQDGAWKNSTPNRVGFSGSASGFMVQASPVPTPLATDCTILDQFVGTFVLTAETGATLTFTGIMTKSALGRAAQKAGTVNYNFEAQGPVVITDFAP